MEFGSLQSKSPEKRMDTGISSLLRALLQSCQDTHGNAPKGRLNWHFIGTSLAAEISFAKRLATITTYFVVVCAYLNRFRRSLAGACARLTVCERFSFSLAFGFHTSYTLFVMSKPTLAVMVSGSKTDMLRQSPDLSIS